MLWLIQGDPLDLQGHIFNTQIHKNIKTRLPTQNMLVIDL